MQPVRHTKPCPDEFQHGIVRQIGFLVAHCQHLDAGQDQKRAEEIQHPRKLGDQCRADRDHDRAQHDDAENAPEQHAVLILPRHSEEAEDQRYDEHIVDGEAFLDHEARQILDRSDLPELPPDETAESEPERDIERGQPQAFANTDFSFLAVQNTKIECKQHTDNGHEAKPHPCGLAEPIDQNKIQLPSPSKPQEYSSRGSDHRTQTSSALDAVRHRNHRGRQRGPARINVLLRRPRIHNRTKRRGEWPLAHALQCFR